MGKMLSEEDWEKVWASLIAISFKGTLDSEAAAKSYKKDNSEINSKLNEINSKLDYIIEKINSKNT